MSKRNSLQCPQQTDISGGKQACTILTCYYRPKPGGFCKRLFRAIHALLDRGQTVHYLAVVPFPIDHPNCHFHRFPWSEKHTSGYLFWFFFHLFAPLQLLYLGFRYRVNRLFAFGHNYGLFLQPLRIVKRIPLTLFLRADTIENHRIKGRSSWLIRLEHLLEGLGIAGTRMYGVSETLTRRTIARHRFLKPSTSGVLRNDIVKRHPGSKKTGKEKRKLPLRLACVGVLEPRKNQRFLLEVMKGIRADQARLYLYGTGPDEQLLKEIVQRENMTDRVHFMGWVEADAIWPNVDLLLMPSLHEGAPNAVLEAIGNGVPVLASDIAEHREILSGVSLLTQGDICYWRDKLINIIDDPDFKIMNIFSLKEELMHQLSFDWDDNISWYVIF
jgi:glycosyltransferase involved in cell wall biosynthesis